MIPYKHLNIYILVDGEGYEPVKTDIRITSSSLRTVPPTDDFQDLEISPSIHVELPKDEYSTSRFFEFVFAKSVVVSALIIHTPTTRALKKFKLEYMDRPHQEPETYSSHIIGLAETKDALVRSYSVVSFPFFSRRVLGSCNLRLFECR